MRRAPRIVRDPRRRAPNRFISRSRAAAQQGPLRTPIRLRAPRHHGAKAAAMRYMGKHFLGRGAYGLDYGA